MKIFLVKVMKKIVFSLISFLMFFTFNAKSMEESNLKIVAQQIINLACDNTRKNVNNKVLFEKIFTYYLPALVKAYEHFIPNRFKEELDKYLKTIVIKKITDKNLDVWLLQIQNGSKFRKKIFEYTTKILANAIKLNIQNNTMAQFIDLINGYPQKSIIKQIAGTLYCGLQPKSSTVSSNQ
jgi:hypothetical protein